MNPNTDKKIVRVGIRLMIPSDRHVETLAILRSATELIRLEEGCLGCRLYQDSHKEGALMLEQIWASQSDMERHLRSDKFHTLLLVIEMASEYPEIRFDVIESTSGMETIQRIRESPNHY